MTELGTKLTGAGYAEATVNTTAKTISVKQKAGDSMTYTVTIEATKAVVSWTDAKNEAKTLDVQGVIAVA